MKKALMVLMVALLGTAVFAGCASKDVTVTTEDGEKVEVKMGAEGISVKTEDGEEKVDVKINKDGVTVNTEEGDKVAKVEHDGETATMTVEDENGEEVVIKSGADAGDVDFPIYENSTKQGGMESSGGAGMSAGAAVSYETTDSVDDVFAFYKEKMKGANVVDMRAANNSVMLVQDESDRAVTVSITEDEGKTIFSIIIAEK